MNEILEIGAVRLDEDLNETGSFSVVIRSRLTSKVRSFVKELTAITNEEMADGKPFSEAFADFERFLNTENSENVIITWSNTDIYILQNNFETFKSEKCISFLQSYADLQRYIQEILGTGKNQISLAAAAERLCIDTSRMSLHRAKDDAALCAEMLKKCYDREKFHDLIRPCDNEFYQRLTFKKHYITDINSPDIDKEKLTFNCPDCKKPMKRQTGLRMRNGAFNCRCSCGSCGGEFIGNVRFKKTFDNVIAKQSITAVKKPVDKTE